MAHPPVRRWGKLRAWIPKETCHDHDRYCLRDAFYHAFGPGEFRGHMAVECIARLKNRRAFYRLGEMSEVELHDIGLTRGDLAVPVDLPFTYDPTAHLGRTARRRINRMETYARYVA